jgi:hypothetical protein
VEAARGEARNATRSAASFGFAGRPIRMPPQRVGHDLAGIFIVDAILARDLRVGDQTQPVA